MGEEPDDSRILHLFGDSSIDDDVNESLEYQKIKEASSAVRENFLKKTQSLLEEEREAYLKEVDGLLSVVEGYENPYFTLNFFSYLFDKTKDMEDGLKARFVLAAKIVYDSTFTVFDENTGKKQGIDSLYSIIWPDTNFINLGFDREGYERLRKEFGYRLEKRVLEHEEFDKDFYKQETVAEMVEFVAGIRESCLG